MSNIRPLSRRRSHELSPFSPRRRRRRSSSSRRWRSGVFVGGNSGDSTALGTLGNLLRDDRVLFLVGELLSEETVGLDLSLILVDLTLFFFLELTDEQLRLGIDVLAHCDRGGVALVSMLQLVIPLHLLGEGPGLGVVIFELSFVEERWIDILTRDLGEFPSIGCDPLSLDSRSRSRS